MAQLAGFLLVFVLCLLRSAPTIYAGDSSLLTVSSYYLSSAHQPGYPLYITIGKLFTFLPLGASGFKLNILSAFFAALSYTLLYRISLSMTGSRALAFFYSLTPIFLPLVFMESLKAEVYTLNAFLCLLIFYLGFKGIEKEDPRFFYLIFFTLGIGMGNHHTLALMIVPVLYAVFVYVKKTKAFGFLLYIPVFFFLGLLIYGHLYIRSHALKGGGGFIFSPALALQDLINIFLRRRFDATTVDSIVSMGAGPSGYVYGFINLFRYIVFENYGYFIAPAAFALFLFSLKTGDRRKGIFLGLALMPWIFILPKMTLSEKLPNAHALKSIAPYYLPLLFLVSIALTYGSYNIYKPLTVRFKRAMLFAPAFLLMPFFYLPVTLTKVDLNSNYLAYDKARDTLSLLPVKSWFIVAGDNPSFSAYYMQWVERLREDILTIHSDAKKSRMHTRYSLFYKNRILHSDGGWSAPADEKITGKDIKRFLDVSSSGRLYAVHPNFLLMPFRENFSLYYALLFFGMRPGGENTNSLTINFSLKNYALLNYERALGIYTEDLFGEEITNTYGYALFYTAQMEDADTKKALEMLSLRLLDPRMFIPSYVSTLYKGGKTEEALSFLKKIETGLPGTRISDISHVVEYELLMRTGDNNAAKKKYEYLKDEGLLVYLGVLEWFLKSQPPAN